MNLYMLIQVMPMRIDFVNTEQYDKNKPFIKIYDNEKKERDRFW